MDESRLRSQYHSSFHLYSRLGQNLVDALRTFLFESNIPILNVYYRIKEVDSFIEKVDRKQYSDPFNEIEDICGIRVICYYASDVDRINKIISKELEVLEDQNKSQLLGL